MYLKYDRDVTKVLYLLGSTKPVNCGNHRATNCKECPKGHGATYCSGDCKWNSDTSTCEGKCCNLLI